MWVLFICTSYTWGLCDAIFRTTYENQADCYKAMEMTLQHSGERPALIRCSPQSEK